MHGIYVYVYQVFSIPLLTLVQGGIPLALLDS